MYESEALQDCFGREIYTNDMTIYFDVVFRRIDAVKKEISDLHAFVADGDFGNFLEELATCEEYVEMDMIGTGADVYQRYGGLVSG